MAGGSLATDSYFDTRDASAVSLILLDLHETEVLFDLTNTLVRSSSQRCLKCHHLPLHSDMYTICHKLIKCIWLGVPRVKSVASNGPTGKSRCLKT